MKNIIDKNIIKLNKKEYDFLKEKGNTILYENKDICDNNDYFIELTSEQLKEVNDFFKVNIEPSDVENYALKKIQENKSRDQMTCRKLAKSYQQDSGFKVSKDYMNKILKNKFQMSYLKTTKLIMIQE